jgi:hypothetical protein
MSRNNNYPTFRYWLNDESTSRLPIPATIPVSNAAIAGADITTNSNVDVLIPDMVLTPGSGDFYVIFDSSISSTDNTDTSISLYRDGVKINETTRVVGEERDAKFHISTQSVVLNVNEGQTIDVRWSTAAGVATLYNRSITALKLR